MSDLSQRLQAAVAQVLQDAAEDEQVEFHAGASADAFLHLEQLTQTRLPEDFKAVYSQLNGQNEDSVLVFEGEEWLSLERVADEWGVWKDLLDNGTFAHGGNAMGSSDAEAGIQSVWWSPKWLPFTYDGSGNHLCIDLDPAAEGTYGQVIRMWHDNPSRTLEAHSFGAWLEAYVQGLEAGEFVYTEDYRAIINIEDAAD